MEPLGYSFDLRIKRVQLCPKELYDSAIKEKQKEIKLLKQKFSKNASKNNLGDIEGRVHVNQ